MKKILALLAFLLVIHTGSAQLFTKKRVENNQSIDKNRLSWGYYLGTNLLDYKFDYKEPTKEIQNGKSFGFNVGLVGDLRINDYINFRLEPGLVISARDLIYHSSNFEGIANTKKTDFKREVKSTYIYVPLLLRFSTKRINNFKPFITGGFATSINLSSNEKNPEDNSSNEFRTTKTTYFYDIGFGIDFYLYWFKFTPSIRGVFALNDELIRDKDPNSPWTGNINAMKTRGIFINFTFR